jgi:hypothetical protein
MGGKSMSNFNDLWEELKKGAFDITKKESVNCAKELSKDVNDFLSEAKKDIETWSIQLAEGSLSMDEFNFLAEGRLKNLAEMKALTIAGIEAAQVDRIRTELVNLAIGTIIKAS